MTGKDSSVIVADYACQTVLNLDELCSICNISADFIHDLVSHEIIHPDGSVPREWVFGIEQLPRIKTALRLFKDLDVNLAGIAVVLDLLHEVKQLRAKVTYIEKYL